MGQNNAIQDIKFSNFILKRCTSIQIGSYFLASAYLIEKSIANFLADDTIMMFLSVQLVAFFIISILLFLFLFSSLALFYSNRRSSRKRHVGIWNPASKKRFRIYLVYCIIGVLTLILLWTNGLHNVIAPAGFILYAILLIILSGSEKNFYLFSGIAFLLAATCFMIPAYWYSSMLILGIVYVVYGIVMK